MPDYAADTVNRYILFRSHHRRGHGYGEFDPAVYVRKLVTDEEQAVCGDVFCCRRDLALWSLKLQGEFHRESNCRPDGILLFELFQLAHTLSSRRENPSGGYLLLNTQESTVQSNHCRIFFANMAVRSVPGLEGIAQTRDFRDT